MNCRDFQNRLNLAVTSDGVEPDEKTKGHLDSCASCREYYQSLMVFAADTAIPARESLTSEEAETIVIGIRKKIAVMTRNGYVPSPARWWQWAIRPVAAAALILMVALIQGGRTVPSTESDHRLEVMSMTETENSNVVPQYLNGDIDQISRLLDTTSAMYITNQVHPAQMEDILNNTTTEELEYMLTNLSAEI